ncbi:MAG: ABC transporter permease, partial [Bacteroidota bacterium]
MEKQPPKNALRFLRWFCRPDFLEEIEGDLQEIFALKLEEEDRWAKAGFWFSVLRYFRPDFIKSFANSQPLLLTAMFKHNLLISYRGFLRNKFSFLINLIGLTTGLASVFFIYLWVQDELQVDAWHDKGAHLYQLIQNYELPNGIQTWEYSPGLTAASMLEDFPEVKEATYSEARPFFIPKGVLNFEEEYVAVEGSFVADNYFEVFSFPLLIGNKEKVLEDKLNMVISRGLALTLFPSVEDAVGKTVAWRTRFMDTTFQVSGVFDKLPDNSTIQFDVAVSYDLLADA